jgi:hypothetical protein
MNSNDGKELSSIVQYLEILRKSGVESLLSLNRMDNYGAELHFLALDKGLRELNIMMTDFKRAMEERKYQS